ncbi:ABC transporter substrate-binding protein [Chryseoglobus sp. 28M-23]|uniref:ABC transporter substrate-binding protein n=1 Tax=Chryseoglobus sp. 28M-23 TaxID=2772253 RepID=UPI00174663BB|nr:ABC transporter substrate-binding protein [Chryseoglobus sp. 28M-23]QOD93098.1 ABC transporter substrate-binding protein [Chryseoglobus sp. 28M-23]
MRPTTAAPSRTRLGLAVAAASVLVLAGCSAGESVDVDGGTGSTEFIAAIGGEPDQFDPQSTSSYFSFQVLENIFDTLVEPDENLSMQPALAESWTVSDDQLTWTFTLREGVTFHDGSEFTSEDVLYSYNRIIDDELANAWRFAAITDITAPDDLTVVIEVASPTPNLLANLGGFKGMAIVNEENVESGDIQSAPVGTGPFVFESYAAGDSIELSSNPDYWDGAPAIDGVTFRFLSEGTTALTALEVGEIQWTDSIPAQNIASLGDTEGITLGQTGSNDYWYLALNQARAPFDDVRVRQAIAYAIDRDAIAQAAWQGAATVNQLAIPESSSWYVEYDGYSTDPERAQELLAEAGVSDLSLEIMVASDYPETVTAAQVMESQLAEAGIGLEIRTLDFGTWLDEQNSGNFDMLLMGWLGNLDPDDFYYAQHYSSGGFNVQGYSNAEVDSLLDAGRVETDEATRYDIYAEAATIIADEASYIYLYNPDVVQAWSDTVSGYEVRGDAAIRFRDVTLNE